MDKNPFLVPIVLVAFFAAIIVFAYRARERRKKALIAAGAEMGFVPTDEASLTIDKIPLFDNRRGEFRTIMQGAAGGYASWLFDYFYSRGKARVVQTVVAFNNPGMNLPLFELHPKGWIDSFASALGNKIVKFPATNPFADRFTIVGPDTEGILRLFTPDLQNYIEGLPQTGWIIEGCNNTLALYRRQKTVAASGLRAFVDDASSVAQGFLAFVSRKGQHFGA